MSAAAFYCMSSDVYFLGAVGLVNSLRLVGHREPIFMLDLGMRPEQRELLEPQVTLVSGPRDTSPWLSKTIAPLRHPAEVMVLIDADMIVTRSLDELLERAAQGEVIAVEHGGDRFVAEWGEVLDLGPVRRQTYVCSGLLLAGQPDAGRIIDLLDDRQRRVDFDRTSVAGNDTDYPLLFLDQDVLNAILASRVEAERIAVLERRLEAIPPFGDLRVLDERALRCAYADGVEPYLVHHFTTKPWLEPTAPGVYTQLLRRLLLSEDVAIRVPDRMLPLHLRPGLVAWTRHMGTRAGRRLRSTPRRAAKRG